jgi:tetratricopeptide (TPR) repeat protein
MYDCENKEVLMSRWICSLLAVTAFVCGQNSDSLVDHAIKLYETRHYNSSNLSKSHDILQQIIENDSENLRALYEFSKVCYLLGDRAATKEEKLEYYELGKTYGKKAIKVDGGSEWAHFWYMVNVGRIGQTKGVLNSLVLVPEVKKEIQKVLKINPEHTGALDAEAMLYYELPGLLGGNLNKSVESLSKGIALDSNYTLLYVDMGRAYIKKKEYDKARWFLKKAVEIEKPTYEADHVLDDKPEALQLLEEIEGK